jgi:hypothetical protein
MELRTARLQGGAWNPWHGVGWGRGTGQRSRPSRHFPGAMRAGKGAEAACFASRCLVGTISTRIRHETGQVDTWSEQASHGIKAHLGGGWIGPVTQHHPLGFVVDMDTDPNGPPIAWEWGELTNGQQSTDSSSAVHRSGQRMGRTSTVEGHTASKRRRQRQQGRDASRSAPHGAQACQAAGGARIETLPSTLQARPLPS